MNKLKSIASAISVAFFTVPVMAIAQWQPAPEVETGLPDAPIRTIIENFMQWLLIIVGILGVIGFAIAGIMYLTAAGDEDRIKQAKSAMIFSIVGIIVALLGLIIMGAVTTMLNAEGTDF